MTSKQINRAVSQATGESVQEIKRRGFYLVGTIDADDGSEEEDRPPQIVNWDELDAWRYRLTE